MPIKTPSYPQTWKYATFKTLRDANKACSSSATVDVRWKDLNFTHWASGNNYVDFTETQKNAYFCFTVKNVLNESTYKVFNLAQLLKDKGICETETGTGHPGAGTAQCRSEDQGLRCRKVEVLYKGHKGYRIQCDPPTCDEDPGREACTQKVKKARSRIVRDLEPTCDNPAPKGRYYAGDKVCIPQNPDPNPDPPAPDPDPPAPDPDPPAPDPDPPAPDPDPPAPDPDPPAPDPLEAEITIGVSSTGVALTAGGQDEMATGSGVWQWSILGDANFITGDAPRAMENLCTPGDGPAVIAKRYRWNNVTTTTGRSATITPEQIKPTLKLNKKFLPRPVACFRVKMKDGNYSYQTKVMPGAPNIVFRSSPLSPQTTACSAADKSTYDIFGYGTTSSDSLIQSTAVGDKTVAYLGAVSNNLKLYFSVDNLNGGCRSNNRYFREISLQDGSWKYYETTNRSDTCTTSAKFRAITSGSLNRQTGNNYLQLTSSNAGKTLCFKVASTFGITGYGKIVLGSPVRSLPDSVYVSIGYADGGLKVAGLGQSIGRGSGDWQWSLLPNTVLELTSQQRQLCSTSNTNLTALGWNNMNTPTADPNSGGYYSIIQPSSVKAALTRLGAINESYRPWMCIRVKSGSSYSYVLKRLPAIPNIVFRIDLLSPSVPFNCSSSDDSYDVFNYGHGSLVEDLDGELALPRLMEHTALFFSVDNLNGGCRQDDVYNREISVDSGTWSYFVSEDEPDCSSSDTGFSASQSSVNLSPRTGNNSLILQAEDSGKWLCFRVANVFGEYGYQKILLREVASVDDIIRYTRRVIFEDRVDDSDVDEDDLLGVTTEKSVGSEANESENNADSSSGEGDITHIVAGDLPDGGDAGSDDQPKAGTLPKTGVSSNDWVLAASVGMLAVVTMNLGYRFKDHRDGSLARKRGGGLHYNAYL